MDEDIDQNMDKDGGFPSAAALFGGMLGPYRLNDLALVTALAIDQAENNQVRATVQFILPQNQSGGG